MPSEQACLQAKTMAASLLQTAHLHAPVTGVVFPKDCGKVFATCGKVCAILHAALKPSPLNPEPCTLALYTLYHMSPEGPRRAPMQVRQRAWTVPSGTGCARCMLDRWRQSPALGMCLPVLAEWLGTASGCICGACHASAGLGLRRPEALPCAPTSGLISG